MCTFIPSAERDRARRLRLGLALDLDQAGPAGRHRVQERMVAEPRDLDADLLGGADDQGALRDGDRRCRRWCPTYRSACQAAAAQRRAIGGAGAVAVIGGLPRRDGGRDRVERPRRRRCGCPARNSSRKCFSAAGNGVAAASPEGAERAAQDLPADVLSRSSSASVPWPASNFSSVPAIQPVPSRHGVHLPHDSCL